MLTRRKYDGKLCDTVNVTINYPDNPRTWKGDRCGGKTTSNRNVSAMLMQLTNISYLMGRPSHFDDAQGPIQNNSEAKYMTRRNL